MNVSETFNEFSTVLLFYHLSLMTDYVVDMKTEFDIGWSCISLLILNLLFNLIIYYIAFFYNVKLSFKRWRYKRAV